MKVPVAAMVNVLGPETMSTAMESSNAALQIENAAVHWYGKLERRKGRKMGHVNLTAPNGRRIGYQFTKITRHSRDRYQHYFESYILMQHHAINNNEVTAGRCYNGFS
jgi:phosphoribosylaminoimidazole carboxylase (NCAIR synthetase)